MKKNRLCAIINLIEPAEALLPLTEQRPLGTLPFAGRYRLLDFPLSCISNAGINTVALFLPRNGRSVGDHVRSGKDWDLDSLRGGVFTFPYNDLAVVAAQQQAEARHHFYDNYIQFLRKSGAEYVVILGTQNVNNIDISALWRYHQQRNNEMTTVYKFLPAEQVAADHQVVTLTEDGKATSILPLAEANIPAAATMVPKSLAIHMIDVRRLIELLQEANRQGQAGGLNLVLKHAVMQNNTSAFEYTGFQANIRSIQEFYAANMQMLLEKNYQALFFSTQQILTKVKNEIPSFFSRDSQVENCLVGTGSYIEGAVTHSVIFRNVLINRRARISDSVIMQGSRIGAGTVIEHAILDKSVVIGPNLKLIGTAEQPLVIGKGQHVYQQKEVVTQ